MKTEPKLKIVQKVIFTTEQKKKSPPSATLPKKATPFSGPLNIFLLGDPAAGKATQAAFLVKKYKLYDLDMGKELRRLQATDPKVRKLLTKTYDKGHVTQTNLVRTIFKKKIFATPKSKGILFDGNPKQIGEAKLIFQWLKQQKRSKAILLYLNIPMSETIKRMSGRVEYFKGKFSKRTDDNKAALENRVKYYRKNIAGVVKFFKTKYPYKQISGIGTKQQVEKRILEFVKRYE
jgi:adenylate kinase